MDQIHVVRHQSVVENRSVRWIARQMGINRRTVKKYLEETEPGRKESAPRPHPAKEAAGPRIDALMKEWAPRLGGKHRLTSARLHRELVGEGLKIGERTVREYLAEKRRQAAEVFIPLVHRAGEEAQVDFFEVQVDEDGSRRKAWKFLMRLMYSGRDFVQLYDSCDRPSFLEGHVRAFAYFGGVPRRMVYDNLSAAVKRVAGMRERCLTARFQALCAHYLFEPCFARPREGHDKGGVEGRGKTIRLQHMTPILAGPDLEAISATVRLDVDRLWRKRMHDNGQPMAERFEEERPKLLPLPGADFDPRCIETVAISRSATAKVYGAVYSLPERWARLDAEARVGARDVLFCCRGEQTLRPRSRKGGRRIEYRDYLRELANKPQAVRQVAPELVAELGEPFGKLWELLDKTHGGRQAGRIMAGVLGAVNDHGREAVSAALGESLAAGSFDAQGACNLMHLALQLPGRPVLADAAVPTALRGVEIEAGCAADYDELLLAAAGGVR